MDTAPTANVRRRSMLEPVAFHDSLMPSLRLCRSSRLVRRIGNGLFAALVCTILLVIIAPWQQTITGSGNVIAFAPLERQQVMEAPIKGRIVRWGDGIVENSRVAKGQLIAEIQDLDAEYSGRLQSQLITVQSQVESTRQQIAANKRALEAAKLVVTSNERQVKAYTLVKEQTIAAQDAYVQMAREKVAAEEHELSVNQAAIPQIEAEEARKRKLVEAGNISVQSLQEIERKLYEQRAKVSKAEAYVAAARSDLEGKISEREAKINKAQVDIDYAKATYDKSLGDVSKAESDIAKSEQELSKAENYLLEQESKVARQSAQDVRAPFDGFIVQITPNIGTAILKEGDPLCVIVPDTKDRAVQLWLDGRDAPLVEVGRHVRLQFEGWPALQFTGWPSVAVGTFGGEVVSIDASDNGVGEFRILIRPDPNDDPWPEERFLRQGVRANGWVLLDQVPLWFEVWRQLNGFTPVVDMTPQKEGSKSTNKSGAKDEKAKPPKLPK